MTGAPALWTKHRAFAYSIADGFYWPGADRDDVKQEALIALWVASRDWSPDGGLNFRNFAALVIREQLKDCLKAAKRLKHGPLNNSIRLLRDEDGILDQAVDQLPHLHQVVDVAEDRARLAAVLHAIDNDLTDLERRAIVGIAAGYSYAELGDPKRMDNLAYKARRKLRAAA